QIPGNVSPTANSAVPFQPPAVPSQQSQQPMDYLLQQELNQPQQYSGQHLHPQQHQHLPVSYAHQQQRTQHQSQQATHGTYTHPHSEPLQHPAQYQPLHQHQHQHQHQFQHGQNYASHNNPYSASPEAAAAAAIVVSLDWSSPVEYSTKDLLAVTTAAPKGLDMLPIVVNPAQLHAHSHAPTSHPFTIASTMHDIVSHGSRAYHRSVGDDNDSIAGTEEDDQEARIQLLDESYLSSSTPPLSPHMAEHYNQSSQGSGIPSRGLIQSLACLTTASPASPTYTPSSATSLSPSVFYATGTPGTPGNLSNNAGYFGIGSQSPASQYAEGEGDAQGGAGSPATATSEGDDEEERQFICPHCQKRFLRQYNLNAHYKTHSTERLHACNECDKSFLRPYDLSRHQRIHSKDKPYACKICSMIFIRNDAIWRHYRKVHQGHPDVPTSRRDKKKNKVAGGMVGALVTPRVVYAPNSNNACGSTNLSRSKSKTKATIPRRSKSKSTKTTDNTSVPGLVVQASHEPDVDAIGEL
ncbi:hypothetical protein BX616_007321, partial [Lobosporangium transversale]